MDIVCPRCKTEYEFEDTKVGETGVAVKCTTCDYTFRVRRKQVVETEPLEADGRSTRSDISNGDSQWHIRTKAGQVLPFSGLPTLQQWIVERKVSRDDQVSMKGQQWRRLGDMPELSVFFQVVEPGSAPMRQPGSYSGPQPDSGNEPQFIGSHMGTLAPSTASEPQWSGGLAALEEGDDADYYRVPKQRWPKVVLGILIAGLLGGGVWAYVAKPPWVLRLFGQGQDTALADPRYQQAVSLSHYDDATNIKAALAKLKEIQPATPVTLASEAEWHLGLLRYSRDEADLLDQQASLLLKTDPNQVTLAQQAAERRTQSGDYLKTAVAKVAAATQLDAQSAWVQRATALLRKEQGEGQRMIISTLVSARQTLPDDPWLTYIEALVAIDAQDKESAIKLFNAADEQHQKQYNKAMVRANFQLALAYWRDKQTDMARKYIATVLSVNPQHTAARLLSQTIDLGAAQQNSATVAQAPTSGDQGVASGVGPSDGGIADQAAVDQVVAGSAGQPAANTPTGRSGNDSDNNMPATYEGLVKQGERVLEGGRTMAAMRFFERAIKIRFDGIEAITGLAYCDLDLQRYANAIRGFQKALRLSATYGDALVGMAEAYNAMGNSNKALDYYRAYLQVNPNGGKAALARRNVAELERKLGVPSATTPESGAGSGAGSNETSEGGSGGQPASPPAAPPPAPPPSVSDDDQPADPPPPTP